MKLYEIINEIRNTTGSNAKKTVMKKYVDNKDFATLLKLAYDPRIKYWVSNNQVKPTTTGDANLDRVLLIKILNPLASRQLTGNSAINWINSEVDNLTENDQELIKLILKRDLRISLNRKSINTVFGDNFIFDPPYMRCQLLNDKTKKGIKFPAYCQLKADGMFVNIIHKYNKETDEQSIELMSRQGERLFVLESFIVPKLKEIFSDTSSEDKDFVLHGECLIDDIPDRKIANGLLNRDVLPEEYHDKVYFMLWDSINYSDWMHRASNVTYEIRLNTIIEFITKYGLNQTVLRLIPTHEINSFEEVFDLYSNYISQGLEGVVVKNKSMKYKHHDSPDQLKVKIKFEIDLEIEGFKAGTGKFEKTFGSIIVKSSDGLLVTRVSGMTDSEREYLWSHKDEVIGKIIELEGNDLFPPNSTNPYWSISHPRYKSLRTDKTEADSLDRVKEIVESTKYIKK